MPKKIAIMGLGPSGMFAARAADDMGCEVIVYQYGESKSPVGAFWFHWLPESLLTTEKFEPEEITILGKGEPEAYTNLQWGMSRPIANSFPKEQHTVMGYNPAWVMPKLAPLACQVDLVPYKLSDLDIREYARWNDLVFQTFPTELSKQYQVPPLPFIVAVRDNDEMPNFVLYNGTGEGVMVRQAVLFGKEYLEFPKGMSESEIRSKHDVKGYTLHTQFDIHPSVAAVELTPSAAVIMLGRHAEWNRHRLSHEVYAMTQECIGGLNEPA